MTRIEVSKEDEVSYKIDVHLKDPDKEVVNKLQESENGPITKMSISQKLSLTLEDRDAEELILVLCGYHKLLTERELEVIQDNSILEQQQQQQQEEDQQGIESFYSVF